MEFHRTRYRKATSYLAYFQSYSNTYAGLDMLRGLYEEALEVPGIIGIVVGTRPDCVDAEKLDFLAELGKRTYVVVEYGIESMFDRTLERVNRGHDVGCSAWAVRETARRGIRVGGHLIVGLPGEGKADFLETVDRISRWPLNSIKFHQLQLIHGTRLAREYKEHPDDFMSFSMEEYLALMVELVSRLNPSFVLERIAGEVSPDLALKQGWGIRYDKVLSRFEAMLEEQDTWQGKKYKELL
jgi:radical SAM protein (TIGR01212 family)